MERIATLDSVEGTARAARILGIVGLVLLGVAFVSVNLFPSINNDGVNYIRIANDPLRHGLVFSGYRQIGYPVLLLVQGILGDVAGVEGLLFTTFAQRLLLLLAVSYAVWLWRWRSIPIVLLVATPSLMAFTNLVMTEALTIPLALLLACLAFHHLQASGDPSGTSSRISSVTIWGVAASAFWLLLIRLPWAIFVIVPLALWFAARRRGLPTRAPGMALVTYLILGALLATALTVENSNEVGVASPNTHAERAAHWAAWQNTFTLHPTNKDIPELQAYYNDGNPYVTIWAIEEANPEYVDQAAELENATRDMLRTAGLDIGRERVFSFFGTLRGGRLDELRPRLETILNTDAATVDDAIHVNLVSQVEGRAEFNNRYNDGHKPQAVITSPLVPSLPLPYVSATVSFLLPISMAGLVLFGIWKRRWIEVAMFSIPICIYSAYLSWFLADNVRFLITTTIYVVAGLCALWTLSARGRSTSAGGAAPETKDLPRTGAAP